MSFCIKDTFYLIMQHYHFCITHWRTYIVCQLQQMGIKTFANPNFCYDSKRRVNFKRLQKSTIQYKMNHNHEFKILDKKLWIIHKIRRVHHYNILYLHFLISIYTNLFSVWNINGKCVYHFIFSQGRKKAPLLAFNVECKIWEIFMFTPREG